MDGEAQPAAAQFSVIDPLLDHGHDEAMPLVEWARTPIGHCRPKDEYASVTASTIHLKSLCFVTGRPLVWLSKLTKSCSDLLKGDGTLKVDYQGSDRKEQGYSRERDDLNCKWSVKHFGHIWALVLR